MIMTAEQNNFCFGKTVLKLGLLVVAVTVFSGGNMSINANETGILLNGHITKNINIEEQNNALFLCEKEWKKELTNKYKGNKIIYAEKGVAYVKLSQVINKRKIKLNVVEVNKKVNPNLEVIPKISKSGLHSRARIKDVVNSKNTIAAVNGTYFKQNTGTPLGLLVINNKILSGPMYERVALLISNDKYEISKVKFNGNITYKKQIIKIDNINQPRTMQNQVLIYNHHWANKSPKMKNSLQISVLNNKIIAKSSNSLIIPKNGYVISAPTEKISKLKIGDKIKINYNLIPYKENTQHVISGGPYLIKNGQTYIDITAEKLNAISGKNPRTAIGYTKDNVLIMVTVEGRKEGQSGVTLKELANIMKKLNCYEAINLDGGSSTVMYFNGKTINGSNISTAMINNILSVNLYNG